MRAGRNTPGPLLQRLRMRVRWTSSVGECLCVCAVCVCGLVSVSAVVFLCLSHCDSATEGAPSATPAPGGAGQVLDTTEPLSRLDAAKLA